MYSWNNTKISSIAELRKGSFDPLRQEDRIYVGLEHIQQNSGKLIGTGRSKETTSMKSTFKKDDILFGKLRPYLRKYWLAEFEGVCATEILVIRAKKDTDNKFLFYLLQQENFINYLDQKSYGTKMPRTSWKEVADYDVLQPPLKEQQKIAEILSSVDEAIEKTEAIIKQTETVKKGLMQQLLTKGVGHTEFKQTEIGEVPVEWDFKKLGDVLNFIGSGSTPKGGRSAYPASGIPLIRSQNVYPDGLRLEEVVFIKEETHETMKRSKVKEKDVLLNITGASIGRCTFVPIGFSEANVNQHVCILRSIPALDYKYLSYFMNSALGQKQIFSEQNGQTREGLNYQQIKKFNIPLPSIEEQEKIVKVIEGVNEKHKAEIESKERLHLLKTSLMQTLLTGKVRVNVDQPEVLV